MLLVLSSDNQGAAESSFRQALTIARDQQAKSLELRAAMSLARLWQQQGKRAEAYALLAPVYGWFTEGFDTARRKAQADLAACLGCSLQKHRGYFFFLVVLPVVVRLRCSASFAEINRPVFASRSMVVVVSFLPAILQYLMA